MDNKKRKMLDQFADGVVLSIMNLAQDEEQRAHVALKIVHDLPFCIECGYLLCRCEEQ